MIHNLQQRSKFKNVDVNAFYRYFEEKREAEAIAFLKTYKFQDIYFLRQLNHGSSVLVSQYYRYVEDKESFI